ncbi:MAG: hypothetical protein OIF32_02595 [Campylobacterales bacterium]|nr:hypothetical protein [Campylobacterales bacterium]
MSPQDIIIGAVERYLQFDKSSKVVELSELDKRYSADEIDETLKSATSFYEDKQYYLDRYTEAMQGEIIRAHLCGVEVDLTKDVTTDFIIDSLSKIKKYDDKFENNVITSAKDKLDLEDKNLAVLLETDEKQITDWEFDPESVPSLVKKYLLLMIENKSLKKDAEKFKKIEGIICG